MADSSITRAAFIEGMRQLLANVKARFGSAVDAEQEEDEWWTVQPLRPGSVGVTWHVGGDFNVDLQVLTESGLGGHWEFRNLDDASDWTLIEDLVWSIAAGRVEELFGPWRTTLQVTLSDGTVMEETGSGLAGLVPAPGWRSRGRRKQYLPWSELS